MPEKQPIDIDTIDSYSLDSRTLAEVCQDYLSIENNTSDSKQYQYYNKHLQQRLRTGESILTRVTDIEVLDDSDEHRGTPALRITADLPYFILPFDDPDNIKRAIRKKGKSGSTSGSFMIAIPADKHGKQTISNYKKIKNCPQVTIQSLDIDKGEHGEIVLEARNLYGQGTEYKHFHRDLVLDPTDNDFKQHIEVGDAFILDPASDDYTGARASEALDYANTNAVCNLFESFMNQDTDNASTAFDEDVIESFVSWARDQSRVDFPPPNTAQKNFITDVTNELSLLQGPPGTGKTSGAIAPAIVGRLLAHNEDGPCRTLVTGPSNKAVDEIMEDVETILTAYQDDPDTDNSLSDTLLFRIAEEPDTPSNSIPGVHYATPYELDEHPKLQAQIRTRLADKPTSDPEQHIICFGTAGRAWSLANNATTAESNTELLENKTLFGRGGEPGEATAMKLFDVLVVDEASMMNVPTFLLAGAFYRSRGNVLVSGDHRQLPPVQEHEWDTEFRPTIRSVAPYTSILNFCRLLRGDEVKVIDDDLHDLLTLPGTEANADVIPLHQLEITYRCHTLLADLLQKWVYSLDDLDYRSDQTDLLAAPSPGTTGRAATLDPDYPVVVVTYDDESSQQSNELEALLSQQLIADTDPVDTAGVVTPHNAQRGLLEKNLKATDAVDIDRVDIDTVERFQGGERDMMIVNGTVSDPDYIAAESDFLLNLNRLNVAMSRMKKKLVVVAAESVFDFIPLDVDSYDQAMLWKGLAKESGLVDETPAWEGSVSEFTGIDKHMLELDTETDEETTIRVYCLDT